MCKKMCLFLLIISTITIISCSSLPVQKEERTLDIKNKAAEYQKSGITQYNSGRYIQALDFFELAFHLNALIDNEAGNALILNSIGKTKLAEAKNNEALEYFDRALGIAERIKNQQLILLTKGNLVDYYIKNNELEKGYDLLLTEIEALNDIKDDESAYLAHNLSLILRKEKKYEEALLYLHKSLKFNEKNKTFRGLAADYYMLASITSLKLNFNEAKLYAEEALKYDKIIEFPQGIAADLEALAMISEKLGDLDNVEIFRNRAKAVLEAIGTINELEIEQTDLDNNPAQ